jgi:hypothetical protein
VSPRILIWAMAFGDVGRPLCKLWLQSLRDVGKWEGDVIVLTEESRTEGRTRFIDVRDMLGYDPLGIYRGCNSVKPFIQFIEGVLGRYDFLFYNDVDVVVSSSRLTPLLHAAAARNEIVVQRDLLPISSGRAWTGCRELTVEERKRYADDSICAGIVGIPVTDLGTSLLADWHAANKANGFGGSDQVRLIKLLLRKYAGMWAYLPETAFGGPTEEKDGATWVHFTGPCRKHHAAFHAQVLGG